MPNKAKEDDADLAGLKHGPWRRKKRFAMFMTRLECSPLFVDKKMSGPTFSVLLAIAAHLPRIRVSQSKLAEETGLPPRTVKRSVRVLKELDILKTSGNKTRDMQLQVPGVEISDFHLEKSVRRHSAKWIFWDRLDQAGLLARLQASDSKVLYGLAGHLPRIRLKYETLASEIGLSRDPIKDSIVRLRELGIAETARVQFERGFFGINHISLFAPGCESVKDDKQQRELLAEIEGSATRRAQQNKFVEKLRGKDASAPSTSPPASPAPDPVEAAPVQIAPDPVEVAPVKPARMSLDDLYSPLPSKYFHCIDDINRLRYLTSTKPSPFIYYRPVDDDAPFEAFLTGLAELDDERRHLDATRHYEFVFESLRNSESQDWRAITFQQLQLCAMYGPKESKRAHAFWRLRYSEDEFDFIDRIFEAVGSWSGTAAYQMLLVRLNPVSHVFAWFRAVQHLPEEERAERFERAVLWNEIADLRHCHPELHAELSDYLKGRGVRRTSKLVARCTEAIAMFRQPGMTLGATFEELEFDENAKPGALVTLLDKKLREQFQDDGMLSVKWNAYLKSEAVRLLGEGAVDALRPFLIYLPVYALEDWRRRGSLAPGTDKNLDRHYNYPLIA